MLVSCKYDVFFVAVRQNLTFNPIISNMKQNRTHFYHHAFNRRIRKALVRRTQSHRRTFEGLHINLLVFKLQKCTPTYINQIKKQKIFTYLTICNKNISGFVWVNSRIAKKRMWNCRLFYSLAFHYVQFDRNTRTKINDLLNLDTSENRNKSVKKYL